MKKKDTDMDLVESRIRPAVEPAAWVDPEPGDDRYSANQVVGAWKAGVEHALQSQQEWIEGIREENLNKAAIHTQIVLDWLHERDIHPVAALLNHTRFDSPEIMLIVPTEQYLELPEGMYTFIGTMESEWSDKHYSVRFSFTYDGENLDRKLLRADGYRLYYTSLQER